MNKAQVFLITTALAGSYGLGEAEFGEARAAVTKVERAKASKTVPTLGAFATNIWNLAQTHLCPEVEAALGANPGDCVVREGSQLILTHEGDKTSALLRNPVEVTVTYGAPQ